MNFFPFLLLTFIAFFTTTTTWAYTAQENDPMVIAEDFQKTVNQLAVRKNTLGLRKLFDDGFIYEMCTVKHTWEDYITFLVRHNGRGKVVNARADKRFIIFQVLYPSLRHEVMIRRNRYGWKFNRAQDMICD